jgi:hypothetical protein
MRYDGVVEEQLVVLSSSWMDEEEGELLMEERER